MAGVDDDKNLSVQPPEGAEKQGVPEGSNTPEAVPMPQDVAQAADAVRDDAGEVLAQSDDISAAEGMEALTPEMMWADKGTVFVIVDDSRRVRRVSKTNLLGKSVQPDQIKETDNQADAVKIAQELAASGDVSRVVLLMDNDILAEADHDAATPIGGVTTTEMTDVLSGAGKDTAVVVISSVGVDAHAAGGLGPILEAGFPEDFVLGGVEDKVSQGNLTSLIDGYFSKLAGRAS